MGKGKLTCGLDSVMEHATSSASMQLLKEELLRQLGKEVFKLDDSLTLIGQMVNHTHHSLAHGHPLLLFVQCYIPTEFSFTHFYFCNHPSKNMYKKFLMDEVVQVAVFSWSPQDLLFSNFFVEPLPSFDALPSAMVPIYEVSSVPS
ncbi:hypothetical protein TSMEX_005011 [Taenia solium]|eukprot:TsM_000248400 transcript=TsM_000248400 gene=TsM_000248400